MYTLAYAHLTLTNVSVLKISLLNLAALILFANQSQLRNRYSTEGVEEEQLYQYVGG
jgi:hypothetical protein